MGNLSGPVNRSVQPSVPSEEAQKQQGRVSSTRAQPLAGVDKAQAVDQAQVEQTPFESVSRSLSESDIMEQLFQIQRPPNQENKQLLSTMIQHGISATAEAFDEIQTLIKGKKGLSSLRAAVVSYSKGLGTSTHGADIVARYFLNETDILSNFKKLHSSTRQFQSILSSHQQLFEPGLFTGMVAIMGEFEISLKKLMKKQKDDVFSISEFKRGKFIHEYKLLLDFLSGVESKFKKGSSGDIELMLSEFKAFKRVLTGALKAFTSQSILSQDMMSQGDKDQSYYYWQFPNPMAPTEQTMDLLIRKDKHEDQARVESDERRIIIRFDTVDLGEVSVIIDLKKNKVSYVFQTVKGETKQLVSELSFELRDRMSDLNYETVKIHALQKRLDIKKLLIPILDLDKMTRIIAEA